MNAKLAIKLGVYKEKILHTKILARQMTVDWIILSVLKNCNLHLGINRWFMGHVEAASAKLKLITAKFSKLIGFISLVIVLRI